MPNRKSKETSNYLSVKSNIARDQCNGLLDDTMIESRCKEEMRKNPLQLCNRVFMTRDSQKPVCKVFCELHRYCFLPLKNGSRCPNLRRFIDKKFCIDHIQDEKECGNLVHKYKNICGDDPKQNRCTLKDNVDVLQKKLDHFNNCYRARLTHHKKCIHKEAKSLGHQHFLMQMSKMEDECNKMLWHEAIEFQPGFDDIEDLDDGFYDAVEYQQGGFNDDTGSWYYY